MGLVYGLIGLKILPTWTWSNPKFQKNLETNSSTHENQGVEWNQVSHIDRLNSQSYI